MAVFFTSSTITKLYRAAEIHQKYQIASKASKEQKAKCQNYNQKVVESGYIEL